MLVVSGEGFNSQFAFSNHPHRDADNTSKLGIDARVFQKAFVFGDIGGVFAGHALLQAAEFLSPQLSHGLWQLIQRSCLWRRFDVDKEYPFNVYHDNQS